MYRFGNMQRTVQGMCALKPPRNEKPEIKPKTAAATIADSAAVVVINLWHTQGIPYNNWNTEYPAQGILSASESPRLSVYSNPGELIE